MTTAAGFVEARKAFHASLLQSTLTINSAGVVSNADSSNTTSKAIAKTHHANSFPKHFFSASFFNSF